MRDAYGNNGTEQRTKPLNAIAKYRSRPVGAIFALLATLYVSANCYAAKLIVHVANEESPLVNAFMTAVTPIAQSGPNYKHPPPNATLVQQFQQFDPFVLPIHCPSSQYLEQSVS